MDYFLGDYTQQQLLVIAFCAFLARVSKTGVPGAGILNVPLMVIYLLAMRLPKNEYIGTGAWYFLILNWLKIPLFVWDGRISMASVKADLIMLPVIAAGAFIGIVILKKIPQKYFNLIIQLFALAAAIKLCWSIKDLF